MYGPQLDAVSGRADLRANAVEFLDSRLLGSPLRQLFLPILEQSGAERLLEAGRQLFQLLKIFDSDQALSF